MPRAALLVRRHEDTEEVRHEYRLIFAADHPLTNLWCKLVRCLAHRSPFSLGARGPRQSKDGSDRIMASEVNVGFRDHFDWR